MSTTRTELTEALQRFVEEVGRSEEDYEYDRNDQAFDLEFLTAEVTDALYGADYLGALETLDVIDTFVDKVRTSLVITCRATGAGWDEIGDAMGRDRQWAWRTYHERADYTDELNDKALDEAGDNSEIELLRTFEPDPKLDQIITKLEAEAKRRYERVRRALSITADVRRRELVEAENEAERAKTPGRRPGPQGKPKSQKAPRP